MPNNIKRKKAVRIIWELILTALISKQENSWENLLCGSSPVAARNLAGILEIKALSGTVKETRVGDWVSPQRTNNYCLCNTRAITHAGGCQL